MVSQSLVSYAKINLFLHIVGKRPDGYHNLQTWFQFIDLHDTLAFEQADTGFVTLNTNLNIGNTEDNLIYRAARAIHPFAKRLIPLNITLEKHIPMGAGLGGGSSNCATTLLALNDIWQCDLSQQQLITLGASLGADVPIFIFQRSAWAEGIGEVLCAKDYIEQYALIIKPRVHASTQTFFSHPQLVKSCSSLDANQITDPLILDNVFTPVFYALYPDVYHTMRTLDFFSSLRLTGTGACLYQLHKDRDILQQNQKKLPKKVDSWIVKTVNSVTVIERS